MKMKLLDLDYDCFGEIYKFLDDDSRCNLLAATSKTEWIRGFLPFIRNESITMCFGPKKSSKKQTKREELYKLVLVTVDLRFHVEINYGDADFHQIFDIMACIGRPGICEKILSVRAATFNFNSKCGDYSIALQSAALFDKVVLASFSTMIPRYFSSLTSLKHVKFVGVEFGHSAGPVYQLPIELLELHDCGINFLPQDLTWLKAVNCDFAINSIISFPLGLKHLHLENIRGGYWMMTLQEVSLSLETLTMLNPAVENFILRALTYPNLKYLEMNAPKNLKALRDCTIDHVVLHDRFGKFSLQRRNGKRTKRSRFRMRIRNKMAKTTHFEDGSLDGAVNLMLERVAELRLLLNGES